METGKTGKYFKYAIGEIVLVVIGILIALQINNWNENRINNEKLKIYLTEIIENLKDDSKGITFNLEFLEKRNRHTKSFLAIEDYNVLSLDSLETSLETFYSTMIFNEATFGKIENSGITDFGDFETIIENLTTHYTYIIQDFKATTVTYNRAVDLEDNFWRYQQGLYEFTYSNELSSYQNKIVAKKQLIELLHSPTARNILKIDYRRNNSLIRRFNHIKERTARLIKDVEKSVND